MADIAIARSLEPKEVLPMLRERESLLPYQDNSPDDQFGRAMPTSATHQPQVPNLPFSSYLLQRVRHDDVDPYARVKHGELYAAGSGEACQ
jgi:hypothetical protein